ncbi:12627_t:CDS:2, partial [Racocetra fulgida]
MAHKLFKNKKLKPNEYLPLLELKGARQEELRPENKNTYLLKETYIGNLSKPK